MNGPRVIEVVHNGKAFAETEWTREWERSMRNRYWIEWRGLFYPRGTPPEMMNNRREITPPVRRLRA